MEIEWGCQAPIDSEVVDVTQMLQPLFELALFKHTLLVSHSENELAVEIESLAHHNVLSYTVQLLLEILLSKFQYLLFFVRNSLEVQIYFSS